MGYAEQRTSRDGKPYYRARFKRPDGRYGTVKDDAGQTIRYATKQAALDGAHDQEADVRARRYREPADGSMTFGAWANRWFGGIDVASATTLNYRRRLENHLLPAFQDMPLAEIETADVDRWVRAKREAGYAAGSIASWRALLHTVLADAVEQNLISSNPAERRRGRGRRTGGARHERDEKVIIDATGALLLAERCAIMSGRDAELVLVLLLYFTGMRWAESVGLERRYARLGNVRVERQLNELRHGVFEDAPPKDDSRRTADIPKFLSALISSYLAGAKLRPCECHGLTVLFPGSGDSPHWGRAGFKATVFTPATSGWYPPRGKRSPAHPVPLVADPFPGQPLAGWYASTRGTASWVPIAAGLTPHGLRHSHKTLMIELGTPEILSHDRLGHELHGIAGVYSHVTKKMKEVLMDQLTEQWETALDARLAMSTRSPVVLLDELLQARQRKPTTKIVSQFPPRSGSTTLSARPPRASDLHTQADADACDDFCAKDVVS